MQKTPRGIRNCNPFNVKVSKQGWRGKVPVEQNTDGTFEQFETMTMGIRCGIIILRTYIIKYQLHTIEEIIKRFAPTMENNTEAYIRAVCRDSGFDRDTTIFFDLDDMTPIALAIIKHENGGLWGITAQDIEKGWMMKIPRHLRFGIRD